jgi:hypothetical protein
MDPTTALSIGRVALGAAAWAAPGPGLRAAMLDRTPQAPFLVRLFGVRDVALGAATLLAGPETRPALIAAGLVVDGADAVASVLAVREGAVRPLPGALFAATAGVAVVTGALALRGTRPPRPIGRVT